MQQRVSVVVSVAACLFAVAVDTAHAWDTASGACVIAGPSQAAVTIEEFADLECQYCKTGSETMEKIVNDFHGQVKLVFRNMPLAVHSHAMSAAQAMSALCLQNPKLAASFQEEVFRHQQRLTQEGEAFLFEVAEKLGLDARQLKVEMSSPEVAQALASDQALAAALNFTGTPSYRIGAASCSSPDTLVTGARPYEEIKKIIEQKLGPRAGAPGC